MASLASIPVPISAAQALSASDASNPSIAVPAAAVFTITGKVSPVNFFTWMMGNVLAIDRVRMLEKAKYTVQLMNHIEGHADFDFVRENFTTFQNQIDVFMPLAGAPLDPVMQTWTGPAGLKENLDKLKGMHKVNCLEVLDLDGLPVAPFDIRDKMEGRLVEIDFHFQHMFISSVSKDNFTAEIVQIWLKKEIDEESERYKPKKLAPVFETRPPKLADKGEPKETKEFRTLVRGELEYDHGGFAGPSATGNLAKESSDDGSSTLGSVGDNQGSAQGKVLSTNIAEVALPGDSGIQALTHTFI
ncbi:hypothetical protein C8J56DRAFT_1040039 [Mycena floridula]|nr:hypothetical protein C8J56DRAFT_1040039 [Mycena floridula]